MDKADFDSAVLRLRAGRPQRAAVSGTLSRVQMSMRPHGFVYPAGMPPCSQCGEDANRGAHVNPASTGTPGFTMERRVISREEAADRRARLRRSHVYSTGYLGFHAAIPCQACGNTMGASAHTPGMPVGAASGPVPGATPMATPVHQMAATLVTEIGNSTLITAPAKHTDLLAVGWQTASANNRLFQWIEGAYVEAEQPNRNAAMWSTKDLEMGEPTVVNGPLNWLHEERHIIGSIAGAKLVHGASDGERAHIRTLSAMWGYLYPQEARQVAAASDEGKLWHSMECVSREVSCLEESCGHTMAYRDYMTDKDARCEHVKAGGPRRFVEPTFLGSAVILGMVRPGWAGATAQVLRQAAADAQTYEASLPGLTEEEATSLVAQLYVYSGAAA